MTGHNQIKPDDGSRLRRFGRAALLGSSELVLAIVLAFLFFLVLMGVLNAAFPQGTGLNELVMEGLGRFERGAAGLEIDAPGEEPATIARITRVTRQVKDRPPDGVAWRASREGLSVEDRHIVQTLSRSSAEITFDQPGKLWLEENSLVVLKRAAGDRGPARDRASLVVLGGQVSGSVSPAARTPDAIELVTAGATAHIRPDGSRPAEYSVTVHPDQSSTLSLVAGLAEVTSKEQTAKINGGQEITVEPSGRIGTAREILKSVDLLEPQDDFLLAYAETPPRVEFQWNRVVGAAAYRFSISHDLGFENLVYQSEVDAVSFVHGYLAAGEYFWRVRGLRDGVAGPAGPVRRLRLVRDTEPPGLQVEFPDGLVRDSRLTLKGSTDVGAQVSVGGVHVPVLETGEFEYLVDLRNGPNVIVVQAMDAAGNIAYRSQYVNAKF